MNKEMKSKEEHIEISFLIINYFSRIQYLIYFANIKLIILIIFSNTLKCKWIKKKLKKIPFTYSRNFEQYKIVKKKKKKKEINSTQLQNYFFLHTIFLFMTMLLIHSISFLSLISQFNIQKEKFMKILSKLSNIIRQLFFDEMYKNKISYYKSNLKISIYKNV